MKDLYYKMRNEIETKIIAWYIKSKFPQVKDRNMYVGLVGSISNTPEVKTDFRFALTYFPKQGISSVDDLSYEFSSVLQTASELAIKDSEVKKIT